MGIKEIYTELSCSLFERPFEALTLHSYCDHRALLVSSFGEQSRARTALTSPSNIRNFQLSKKNKAIIVRSWRTNSAIFPTWSRYECDMSAIWAQYQRLKCAYYFLRCLNVTWAGFERNVSATWVQKLPCAILPFCLNIYYSFIYLYCNNK